MDTINNQCFRTLPSDPYLFYTNEAKKKNNELVFLQSEGDVFILRVQDKHHDTCPQSFQLQNDANFTTGLHSKVQVKKNMLVELCAKNYATHDDIVIGAWCNPSLRLVTKTRAYKGAGQKEAQESHLMFPWCKRV